MAVYSGPENARVYDVKFVRLNTEIWVSNPEDDLDSDRQVVHRDLLPKAELHSKIQALLASHQEEQTGIDAGKIRFWAGDLVVCGGSIGYKIKDNNSGRPLTTKLVEKISPGWRVFSDFDKFSAAAKRNEGRHFFYSPEQQSSMRQEVAASLMGRELTERELQDILAIKSGEVKLEDFLKSYPDVPFLSYLGPKSYFEHFGYLDGRHTTIKYPLNPRNKYIEVITKVPVVS